MLSRDSIEGCSRHDLLLRGKFEIEAVSSVLPILLGN